MKVRVLPIVIATVSLFASAVHAQRPECPPTKPGACFVDVSDTGMFGFLVDGEDNLLVIGPLDEDNDFFKFPPNGKRVQIHQIDNEASVGYCEDVQCEAFTHIGTGRVSANVSATPDFSGLSCPTSIHVNGRVVGPFGGEFDLTGVLVTAPSKKDPSGCKVILNDVSISPR